MYYKRLKGGELHYAMEFKLLKYGDFIRNHDVDLL